MLLGATNNSVVSGDGTSRGGNTLHPCGGWRELEKLLLPRQEPGNEGRVDDDTFPGASSHTIAQPGTNSF